MDTDIREIGDDTEIDRLLHQRFLPSVRKSFVEVGEDKICMPIYYKERVDLLRKFAVRGDDVIIAAFPKTGTTWLSEMVWLILNNFDYEGVKKQLLERVPFLELSCIFDLQPFGKDNLTPFRKIEKMDSPRCFKTHMPWNLLPDDIVQDKVKPKIIVLRRIPEDVCVSLFYHNQAVEGYTGTFEEFCELFLSGRVIFCPFWKNVLSYSKQKDNPNVLFITYERMKDDLPSVIKTVADFLNTKHTDEQITELLKHLSFDSMKSNSFVNYEGYYEICRNAGYATANNKFIRSGKVGNHKTMMSPELIERFKKWTEENLQGVKIETE